MTMGVDLASPTRSAQRSWRGSSSVGRQGLGKVRCSSRAWTSLMVRGGGGRGEDNNVGDNESV